MTTTLPAPTRATVEALHAAAETRADRYRALVVASANEVLDADPDELLVLLEALDKTPHDFAEDVEAYLRRATAAKRFAEVPALKARANELARETKKLRDEFDKFVNETNRKLRALSEEETRVSGELVSRENEYRREFHPDVCPYPEAVEEYRRALEARAELIRQRAHIFERLQENRALLAGSEAREESADAQRVHRDRVKRDEQLLPELDAQLLAATAAVDAAERETLKP